MVERSTTEGSGHAQPAESSEDATPPGVESQVAGAVAPGDCLGRYTLIAPIGKGGMGEVFAAHDPELGRTIALKLIRQDRGAHAGARLRLLREAQALARLHHPNVVTVHDVGRDDERVFLAMERIEGSTFTEWLKAGEHGWREVLARMLDAGRGLAAAHDAGIVHRDFKPENVLVGKDRVVVVDFGLARAGDEPVEEGKPSAILDAEVTKTGDRVGTPSYMAPEVLAGGRSDALSDQFSFCVSLWEALHGTRPKGDGEPKNPEVPAWTNEAIRRGLAHDPTKRWPSMHALLATLGRDPRAARRTTLLVAGAIVLAGAATWSFARSAPPDPCASGPTRIAQAWGGTRKDAVRAAFLASKSPTAEATFARVSAALDDYTGRWSTMYGQTCRATRVEGRQSDAMMDLRMSCLEQRRAVLSGVIDLWSKGVDEDALAHADDAVRSLGPLAECADTRALSDRAPPPKDKTALIKGARQKLDELEASIAAHRLSDAKAAAPRVRAEVEKAGWPLLSAESAFAQGDVLVALQDAAAEAPLLESARLATASRDDRLAARAYLTLAGHLASTKQNAEKALLLADVADGLVSRLDDPGELKVQLLRSRGSALMTQGKYDPAKAALEEARQLSTKALGQQDRETLTTVSVMMELARQMGDYAGARKLGEDNLAAMTAALGPDHPDVAQLLTNLSNVVADGDDPAAAVDYARRALAIQEKITGPDSAATASALNFAATGEARLQHIDEADAFLTRALAIRERVFGPDDVNVAGTLVALADVRGHQHRFDEGIELDKRALAISIKTYGPEHRRVAIPLHKIGILYDSKRDYATALTYYQRALDLRKKLLGPEHEMTLFTMTLYGAALAKLHRCAEAKPVLAAAEAGLLPKVGENHSDYLDTQNELARCELDDGKPEKAAARLERAVAIKEKPGHRADERGRTRMLFARALWGAGKHAEGVAQATTAVSELETSAGMADDAKEARDWLSGHRAVH